MVRISNGNPKTGPEMDHFIAMNCASEIRSPFCPDFECTVGIRIPNMSGIQIVNFSWIRAFDNRTIQKPIFFNRTTQRSARLEISRHFLFLTRNPDRYWRDREPFVQIVRISNYRTTWIQEVKKCGIRENPDFEDPVFESPLYPTLKPSYN